MNLTSYTKFNSKWMKEPNLKAKIRGTWVAQSIKCLPTAQIMIPGSWDRALCIGRGAFFSLSLCPPPFPHLRSLSNKYIKSFKKYI